MANPLKSSSSNMASINPEPASANTTSALDSTGVLNESTPTAPAAPSSILSDEQPPPPKPPRPLSAREQAEKTLGEAFPSIDAAVIKAVLTAGGGNVESAFDALLGMTDPESQQNASPPAKPPRPIRHGEVPTSTAQSQLEADEMYARQLHEHYSGASRQQRESLGSRQQAPIQQRRGEEVREYSFLDDDLPMIRENIRKGFLETQSTVNKWVTNFKKKLDGDDAEGFSSQPARAAQGYQAVNQSHAHYGRRSSDMAQRSADRERYDADPHVLGDDFSTLELRDTEAPPKKPQRPLANPELFKPGSPATTARKVSFQAGPPEDIDSMYPGSSPASKQQGPGGKPSKWQPLSAVEPSPVAENDPFSLGDSDDDNETRAKDNKADDGGRHHVATADTIAGSAADSTRSDSSTTRATGTKT